MYACATAAVHCAMPMPVRLASVQMDRHVQLIANADVEGSQHLIMNVFFTNLATDGMR